MRTPTGSTGLVQAAGTHLHVPSTQHKCQWDADLRPRRLRWSLASPRVRRQAGAPAGSQVPGHSPPPEKTANGTATAHAVLACWPCAQASAYRVLLTHFSTRYPRMPELDLQAHPHMAVAMDFMSVNLADLQVRACVKHARVCCVQSG